MITANRPEHAGVVEYILEGPGRRLRVAIAPHAALYILDRGSHQFAAWFTILETSRIEKRSIKFTHDGVDLNIMSLELSE